MNSPTEPQGGRATADLEAARRLLDDLRRSVTTTLDELDAKLNAEPAGQPVGATFAGPVPVPPRRMEQLVRTPEPTADLDDLVDVLVPRLVEQLVPALRDALRNE